MVIIHEAIVGKVKFTFAKGQYLAMEEAGDSDHAIVLQPEEYAEIIPWLAEELGLKQKEKTPSFTEEVVKVVKKELAKDEVCSYIPSERRASQTVPLKVGDPNLAYRDQGGPTEIVDLGRLKGPIQHE